MFIETYQVEERDGRKVIHYNGFSWARQDDDFPYAMTEGSFCYVEIGEENYRRACEAFELVQQCQEDFANADELLDAESCWKRMGNHLHMDDVTQDTPCGMYWFELDEDWEKA